MIFKISDIVRVVLEVETLNKLVINMFSVVNYPFYAEYFSYFLQLFEVQNFESDMKYVKIVYNRMVELELLSKFVI